MHFSMFAISQVVLVSILRPSPRPSPASGGGGGRPIYNPPPPLQKGEVVGPSATTSTPASGEGEGGVTSGVVFGDPSPR